MRASLSISIIKMVLPINESQHGTSINLTEGEIVCPTTDQKQRTIFDLQYDEFSEQHYTDDVTIFYRNAPHRYDWSQEEQGIILSSFYWGYLISHLPGGLLAQRFGGKPVLGIGILFCGLISLVTPFCVTAGIVE